MNKARGAFGWASDLFETPVARFEPIEPEQMAELRRLRGELARASARAGEYGDDLIISALVGAMGDDAVGKLHAFLVATVGLDHRDLNALCQGMDGRLLVVDQPRVLSTDT